MQQKQPDERTQQHPDQTHIFVVTFEVLASLRDVWLVLLGAGTAALFGRLQARHMLYNQARMKFRAAFLPELAQLLGDHPAPDECATLQLLETSHPGHHAAYVELWAASSRWQRRGLEKRWHRYRHGKEPNAFDEPFTYLASNSFEEPGMRKLAAKYIHHLIA